MLPNWLIEKANKKKEKFIQEQLQIEIAPLLPLKEEKPVEKDDIDRGIDVIEMF